MIRIRSADKRDAAAIGRVHVETWQSTYAGLLPDAMVTFSRHPAQWRRIVDDPSLIPNAVEELLRYVPITRSGLERVATEDVELSGVTIPAGSTVLPLPNAAHFDPRFVPDPLRLDVGLRRPLVDLGAREVAVATQLADHAVWRGRLVVDHVGTVDRRDAAQAIRVGRRRPHDDRPAHAVADRADARGVGLRL